MLNEFKSVFGDWGCVCLLLRWGTGALVCVCSWVLGLLGFLSPSLKRPFAWDDLIRALLLPVSVEFPELYFYLLSI